MEGRNREKGGEERGVEVEERKEGEGVEEIKEEGKTEIQRERDRERGRGRGEAVHRVAAWGQHQTA